MKKKDHKILAQDKRKLQKRLAPKAWADPPEPMFQAVNLHYERSEKSRAIGFGGVGAIHTMGTRLGLDQAINENLSLLKTYVPYFESDHVLNIASNVVTGGTCLEDIDRLRDDDLTSSEERGDPAMNRLEPFECVHFSRSTTCSRFRNSGRHRRRQCPVHGSVMSRLVFTQTKSRHDFPYSGQARLRKVFRTFKSAPNP